MVLNKGGKLSAAYFLAYLELVSNTRQGSREEVYDIVFERLFERDERKLGAASFLAFKAAYEQFSQKQASI
ncbi:hypothetical protein SFC66_16210 [Terribacillus saccharophilus]|uniref:hypothetical protein n=1 Tax=Terribacillus saccharophilus TaxID=361277 RepID=UPI0039821FA7